MSKSDVTTEPLGTESTQIHNVQWLLVSYLELILHNCYMLVFHVKL